MNSSRVPAPGVAAQPAGSVLLVEDDPTYQVVVQAALSQAGYTVQVAVDGPEMMARLATLAARPPQLVILDWLLPGPADGLLALR
ncbi:MAG: response regulator, partial [Chloroflexi bacterium]|nr:response regulator [Chloroflexota bacterium]